MGSWSQTHFLTVRQGRHTDKPEHRCAQNTTAPSGDSQACTPGPKNGLSKLQGKHPTEARFGTGHETWNMKHGPCPTSPRDFNTMVPSLLLTNPFVTISIQGWPCWRRPWQ